MQNTGTIRAAFDAAVGLQGGYSDGPDKQRDNAGINGRTCTYQTPENAAKNTPINVNCCSQCSASTSVKRMMMLRDPVKHFSSQLAVYKSALNGSDGTDTYLFSMVGEIPKLDTLKQLVRARRADAARLAATGTGAGAPERRPSAATFDSYGRLVPPPSAPAGPVVDATDQDIDVFSVASLHSSFGKLFDNPQTRFLLGFPYCAPGMQQAPPAYNSITAARPATAGWDRGAYLRQRRGVAAATGKDPWAKFRESVSDDQMRALIVAAVEDLFFVGITEEWDRSVLVLRNITGWGLRGYNKVLHTTDNGHPGTTKRVALTDKDVAAIRELNKWDEFVFRTATARLHRQAKMIGVVDSQATCKQSSQPKASGQMLVACKFPELYMPGELAAEEQREEQLAKEALRRAAVARGQRWSPKSQAEEERKRALADVYVFSLRIEPGYPGYPILKTTREYETMLRDVLPDGPIVVKVDTLTETSVALRVHGSLSCANAAKNLRRAGRWAIGGINVVGMSSPRPVAPGKRQQDPAAVPTAQKPGASPHQQLPVPGQGMQTDERLLSTGVAATAPVPQRTLHGLFRQPGAVGSRGAIKRKADPAAVTTAQEPGAPPQQQPPVPGQGMQTVSTNGGTATEPNGAAGVDTELYLFSLRLDSETYGSPVYKALPPREYETMLRDVLPDGPIVVKVDTLTETSVALRVHGSLSCAKAAATLRRAGRWAIGGVTVVGMNSPKPVALDKQQPHHSHPDHNSLGMPTKKATTTVAPISEDVTTTEEPPTTDEPTTEEGGGGKAPEAPATPGAQKELSECAPDTHKNCLKYTAALCTVDVLGVADVVKHECPALCGICVAVGKAAPAPAAAWSPDLPKGVQPPATHQIQPEHNHPGMRAPGAAVQQTLQTGPNRAVELPNTRLAEGVALMPQTQGSSESGVHGRAVGGHATTTTQRTPALARLNNNVQQHDAHQTTGQSMRELKLQSQREKAIVSAAQVGTAAAAGNAAADRGVYTFALRLEQAFETRQTPEEYELMLDAILPDGPTVVSVHGAYPTGVAIRVHGSLSCANAAKTLRRTGRWAIGGRTVVGMSSPRPAAPAAPATPVLPGGHGSHEQLRGHGSHEQSDGIPI